MAAEKGNPRFRHVSRAEQPGQPRRRTRGTAPLWSPEAASPAEMPARSDRERGGVTSNGTGSLMEVLGHAGAGGGAHGDGMLDLALLETLLENAPLGIALLDPALRFLRVNATLAKINGLPVEEHLGRPLGEVLPRFPQRLLPLLRQVARTGKPVVNLELTGQPGSAAPGTERTFLASYYPVYSGRSRTSPGSLLGIGAIVMDITDRKRAQEAALAATRQSAEQMRQFLREILTSVTEGRLHLCDTEADLPVRLPVVAGPLLLERASLRAPREALATAARDRGFPAERWQDLMTAAGEASMNAVMHADGGTATIRATAVGADRASIQVWVEDTGSGIELGNLHKVTLGRGFSTRGSFGHGFYLMLHSCDRLYLLTRPTGTTLVIEQDREAPEPAWLEREILVAPR